MTAWTYRVGWGDRVLIPVTGVKEDACPFIGNTFQATQKDLEGKMREAASDRAFEGERREHGSTERPPARRPEAKRRATKPTGRSQIKKLKLLDLEFANEIMTGAGAAVDKAAPKKWRAEAAAEKAEAFRKGRL